MNITKPKREATMRGCQMPTIQFFLSYDTMWQVVSKILSSGDQHRLDLQLSSLDGVSRTVIAW